MAESVSFSQMSYTCIFGWKVRNIFSVHSLQSKPLHYDKTEWKLEIRKTSEEFVDDAICIFLTKMNNKKSSHEFKVITYVEDCFKKRQFLEEKNINVSNSSETEIWKLTINYFQQHKNVESDGVVAFVFMFTSMEYCQKKVEKESKVVQTPQYMELDPSLESLSSDIRKILNEGEPDVQLKSSSSSIFAHRLILKARSEEFAKILNNKEIIQIKVDMDSSVLNQFLEFIYSGKLSALSDGNVQLLYGAASTYAIRSLKDLCTNFMIDNLTEYNACDILVLADEHRDEDLKEIILSYIVEKELALKDSQWETFSSSYKELAIEILNKSLIAKDSSDRISDLLLKFPQK